MSVNRKMCKIPIVESSLHAIYGVAEHIDTDERVYMPACAALISSIPFDQVHEKVLGIALDTIGNPEDFHSFITFPRYSAHPKCHPFHLNKSGAYAEWYKENPTFIPNAVQVVLFGLNSTQTAQASFALKDLCRESQLQLQPNAEHILQACHQAITAGHIAHSDEVRLMYSIGRLMSMLPTESVLQWLNVFVSPCFAELQAISQTQVVCSLLASGTNAKPNWPKTKFVVCTQNHLFAMQCDRANKSRTMFRLNMVSTLFSSLNTNVRMTEDKPTNEPEKSEQQPVLMIMQQTMPIFKDVAAMWATNSDICEVSDQ